jgi:hypothetical protein
VDGGVAISDRLGVPDLAQFLWAPGLRDDIAV